MHRLARDDARGLHFHALAGHVGQGALAVDGIAQAVNHAAQQATADGDFHDGAGTLDGVAFLDGAVVAENHDTDIVGLEVQRHALDATREFDHFTGLDLVQTIDAGDAVTDRKHGADLGNLGLGAKIGDLILKDSGDFRGADFHHPTPFIAS